MLRYMIGRKQELEHLPAYADATARIKENTVKIREIKAKYKKDLKDAKGSKAKAEIKEAYENNELIIQDEKDKLLTSELRYQYGFTEFGFINAIAQFREPYSTNISSTIAGVSIAKPMWKAFEKYFFGEGKGVHYKKFKDDFSFASDARSGLRLLNEDGQTVFCRENNEKLFLNFSSRGGKSLTMPLIVDKNNDFALMMLERKVKVIRLTRKWVVNKWRYYCQLTVEGIPAEKYTKDGDLKHHIGSGRIGIYIDTTSITVAKDGKILFSRLLTDGDKDYSEIIKECERLRDNSSRALNPTYFNEDGTCKKVVMEDGKRTRKQWVRSQNYSRIKGKEKDLYRKMAETRKINRERLANEILSLGDEVYINNYDFKAAQRRKDFDEEEEKTESGRYKSKSKAGENIKNAAPSMPDFEE